MRRTKSLQPVIKWPGSKRKIAPLLAPLFPDADHYFEPFVGGGAMLPFRPCRTAVAGDVVVELIELWKTTRNTPELTSKEYEKRWNRLQNEGYTAYYDIRDSFNVTRNPHDLLFLSRTCVNGLIRFNKKGEFNNSLHYTRPGIAPGRLRRIILHWSYAIQGVEFLTADYRQTLAPAGACDVVFLDPPYGGTRGRYLPSDFNLDEFYDELQRLNTIGAKWILTFDGRAGKRSYTTSIPPELYKVRFALQTGNSPFTKLMRTSIDAVIESVYFNFEPSIEPLDKLVYLGKQEASRSSGVNVQQSRLFD